MKKTKILTAKNGVALIAVLVILLVLTLFVPVLFTMSDSAVKSAQGGAAGNRLSYLARSVTEMNVAAFEKTYYKLDELRATATGIPNDGYYNKLEEAYDNLIIDIDEIDANPDIRSTPINSAKVYMYYNSTTQKYEYEDSKIEDTAATKYIGQASCVISFDDSIHYYKVFNDTQEVEEIATKEEYENLLAAIKAAITAGTATDDYNYSLSKVENRNIMFESTAFTTENGMKKTHSCILVLPTKPTAQSWLVFNGEVTDLDANGMNQVTKGCNQVQFDVSKISGMSLINYSENGVQDKKFNAQPLQIYSCLGNMIIDNTNIKDDKGKIVNNGINGSELVLGMNPQLNTNPDNDPTFNMLAGINAATYKNNVQKDSFIAVTATNAIEVDMPINLMVNPTRAGRLGDGSNENNTIYKVMIFQAPTIYFARNIDMMISLYQPIHGINARRMSSVVLAAPSNTPYSYYNTDRKKTVKAGMVYFAEDCYLWIINYGYDGSGYAEHWYEVNSTVYYRDKDFTKIKVASAGDVCYFNTEVEMDANKDTGIFSGIFGGNNTGDDKTIKTALPLSGYALETIYFTNYSGIINENKKWWRLWTNTKQAIFGYYVNNNLLENSTYVTDDLHKIGNVYQDSNVQFPEIDDFYAIWSE